MSDDLPWLKMLVLMAMLVAMFAGPFLAIAVNERRQRRRGAAEAEADG